MDQNAFDYVIVGGGSAGCVLASRLSEDPAIRVCLLEAGGSGRGPLVNIPLALALTVPWPFGNWGFQTVPQAGLNWRRGYQPRGRGLGGSSNINAMIYTRGHPSDYDAWAAAGNRGWAFADVLPYFRRAERNAELHDDYHGNGGPLPVENLRTGNPLNHAFVEAGRQAGFPVSDDFNGAQQEGVGIYQVTQHRGERWSVARAYLQPHLQRPNLRVVTGAHARRILFSGKRATGVEFRRGGRIETVSARSEVVLSAGSFQSPQLLMLSGIGGGSRLQQFGIPVLADLPGVGSNLQDHLDYTLIHRACTTDVVSISPTGLWHLLRATGIYRRERRGMLTSNVAESGGFVKSDPALDVPDIQLHFCVAIVDNHGRSLRHWWRGYTLHACVLRPASRGQVLLRSRDPAEPPLIDPQFLSHADDLELLLKGFRIARKILNAPALARFRTRELFTGGVESDDALRDAIRNRADTIYHPVGTCRMGNDERAVVDSALRVRMVDGLRVVDASIMPTLIGGNTNAPVVMIAEKAADLILQSRRGPSGH